MYYLKTLGISFILGMGYDMAFHEEGDMFIGRIIFIILMGVGFITSDLVRRSI